MELKCYNCEALHDRGSTVQAPPAGNPNRIICQPRGVALKLLKLMQPQELVRPLGQRPLATDGQS